MCAIVPSVSAGVWSQRCRRRMGAELQFCVWYRRVETQPSIEYFMESKVNISKSSGDDSDMNVARCAHDESSHSSGCDADH